MTKKWQWVLGAAAVLAAASLAAPRASGQDVQDSVITIAYVSVKAEQTQAWLAGFKKHLQPALEELRAQGALKVHHLFVPGLHHPGHNWTHALVLVVKDRAAQAAVEKKLRETLAGMPADDSKSFFAALDPAKHYDEEWRELDLAKVSVPEEKKPAEKKEAR